MKKKERRFQTLEDVEARLKTSSGLRKKQKKERSTGARTAVPKAAWLHAALSEYGRLLVIPAASVVLIVLILFLQAAFGDGRSGGTPQPSSAEPAVISEAEGGTETGAQDSREAEQESGEEAPEAETEGTEAETEPAGPIACRIPEIEQTANEYFAARLSADADTLYRLYGRTSDTGKEALVKKLKAQASWIQSYDGISVYTMPGMDENSKVCIITYRINFRRTNTAAPGIMYSYMTKQADGSWQIGENLRSDKVRYIDQKLSDPEVVAMQEEVDGALRNALNSDSTLALIYTSFLNGEIYNETAPDLNSEQEVDFLKDPAASDLAGGLIIENESADTENESAGDADAAADGSAAAGEEASEGGEAAAGEAPEESSETAADAETEADTAAETAVSAG